MYKYIFLLSALMVCGLSYELDCLTETPIETCINCICYAKTGTWDIYLCGRRLITLANWRASGSLSTSSSWRPLLAWRSCKEDVNCILNSIKRYTEQFGGMDCNLDGVFDCQDRFGIQIHKSLCVNRRIPPVIFNRFHSCLPNVMEAEGRSRNKQRALRVNQDVEVVVEQNVNGDTNEADQNVHVVANQNSRSNAKQAVSVVVEQNA